MALRALSPHSFRRCPGLDERASGNLSERCSEDASAFSRVKSDPEALDFSEGLSDESRHDLVLSPPLGGCARKVKCSFGLVLMIFVTHSPKVGASCLVPDVGCIFLADFSEGPSDASRKLFESVVAPACCRGPFVGLDACTLSLLQPSPVARAVVCLWLL